MQEQAGPGLRFVRTRASDVLGIYAVHWPCDAQVFLQGPADQAPSTSVVSARLHASGDGPPKPAQDEPTRAGAGLSFV